MQQGDPLGLLIFCLTIHSTLLQFKSEFLVGYMDGIMIGRPVASVASDIKVTVDDGSAKGKYLNVIKCKLISDEMPPSIALLGHFFHVKSDDISLLGAPLLTDKALDIALEKKYTELERVSERVQFITSCDVSVLLKLLCNSPRLMHTVFILRG